MTAVSRKDLCSESWCLSVLVAATADLLDLGGSLSLPGVPRTTGGEPHSSLSINISSLEKKVDTMGEDSG
jgi:hypothetical protein